MIGSLSRLLLLPPPAPLSFSLSHLQTLEIDELPEPIERRQIITIQVDLHTPLSLLGHSYEGDDVAVFGIPLAALLRGGLRGLRGHRNRRHLVCVIVGCLCMSGGAFITETAELLVFEFVVGKFPMRRDGRGKRRKGRRSWRRDTKMSIYEQNTPPCNIYTSTHCHTHPATRIRFLILSSSYRKLINH